MKKFVGLLKQEYRYYSLTYFITLVLTAVFVILGPELLVQFFRNQITSHVTQIRFTLTIIAASLVWIFSLVMFASSLQRDMKIKDLWLHNSQSIYALIGAKIVSHGVGLLALSFIASIGFLFVGDLIVGTPMQYLILGVNFLILIIMVYIFFIVICLVMIALNKQLSIYIGKVSYFVMLIAAFLLFDLIDRLPNFTFLQIGRIPLSNMNVYLPTFAYTEFDVSLFFDFYLVEEIVMIAVIILIYMLSCKWIERVITR